VNARYQVTKQDIENGARSTMWCAWGRADEYHTEPGQPTVWRMIHENSTYNSLEDAVQQRHTQPVCGSRLTDVTAMQAVHCVSWNLFRTGMRLAWRRRLCAITRK